ncbi:hypothetical protein I7I51_00593 [Histoplasma capsulatum]|uniref:Uncharacterized protein n=1 Tax=Ajellomyces capsulatus TaxID=5037 RepID=A0A8A1MCG3_AJECA|nr:hypothetical protein I7I51_00593 [Histoplasma capsulatum]
MLSIMYSTWTCTYVYAKYSTLYSSPIATRLHVVPADAKIEGDGLKRRHMIFGNSVTDDILIYLIVDAGQKKITQENRCYVEEGNIPAVHRRTMTSFDPVPSLRKDQSLCKYGWVEGFSSKPKISCQHFAHASSIAFSTVDVAISFHHFSAGHKDHASGSELCLTVPEAKGLGLRSLYAFVAHDGCNHLETSISDLTACSIVHPSTGTSFARLCIAHTLMRQMYLKSELGA